MKKDIEVDSEKVGSTKLQEHDFSNDPNSEENLRKQAIISGELFIPEIPFKKPKKFEA